ncbi:MAG: DUF1080 domain-containing protein [Undibacterium sp.]|nr:DUF1080 domain-containing protein [Opitutaceae bacterium]
MLATHAAEAWAPLCNGRDLTGWATWLGKPHASAELSGEPKDAKGNYTRPLGAARDPLGVFTVTAVDGQPAIRISGQIFGELRTRESFSNYHLRLQFKWGEKKWAPREKPETPRDSGLLYHVHAESGAEGRTWSRSTELQIQERDVGDLYAIGSFIFVRSKLRSGTGNGTTKAVYDYEPKGAWNAFAQVPGQDGRCVKQPDNERPTGEWNTVELICFGEDSIHIVNGKVVMRLHRTLRIDTPTPQTVTSGPLILQSEGAEIFYRGIELRPITAMPAEWAEK